MIIAKTPFRISFAGGGTDLSSFYRDEPGAVVSTSINKYMYIAVHPFFFKHKTQLKYSRTELVENFSEIEHPIFREVLQMFNLSGIDLNSIADVPAGTGLGSSSAFTVCLLNAIHAYVGKETSKHDLAEMACDIEINRLSSPIGKQDQYAAAFGGLNYIEFLSNEKVRISPIALTEDRLEELSNNLIMIYTGSSRSADDLLKHQLQEQNSRKSHSKLAHRKMLQLASSLREALEADDLDGFGDCLHEGWQLKKSLSSRISNSLVDEIYQSGVEAGALGGKLLGAGEGGFILFYVPVEKQDEFFYKMRDYGNLNFRFERDGSKIIYRGETPDGLQT